MPSLLLLSLVGCALSKLLAEMSGAPEGGTVTVPADTGAVDVSGGPEAVGPDTGAFAGGPRLAGCTVTITFVQTWDYGEIEPDTTIAVTTYGAAGHPISMETAGPDYLLEAEWEWDADHCPTRTWFASTRTSSSVELTTIRTCDAMGNPTREEALERTEESGTEASESRWVDDVENIYDAHRLMRELWTRDGATRRVEHTWTATSETWQNFSSPTDTHAGDTWHLEWDADGHWMHLGYSEPSGREGYAMSYDRDELGRVVRKEYVPSRSPAIETFYTYTDDSWLWPSSHEVASVGDPGGTAEYVYDCP